MNLSDEKIYGKDPGSPDIETGPGLPSGDISLADEHMKWLEDENLDEEWVAEESGSLNNKELDQNIPGNRVNNTNSQDHSSDYSPSNGNESVKATATLSSTSTDIIATQTPTIGSIQSQQSINTSNGTVNIHSSVYSNSSNTGTVQLGTTKITPQNQEEDFGTTKYQSDSVLIAQPKQGKSRVETAQWKRAINKNQEQSHLQAYHHNHSKEHSFQRLFDPPTVDRHDLKNVKEIYDHRQQQEENIDISIQNENGSQGFGQSNYVHHQPRRRFESKNSNTNSSTTTTTTNSRHKSMASSTSNFSRTSSNITTTTNNSSASPLKLFSKHDTYTNTRLDNLLDTMGGDDESMALNENSDSQNQTNSSIQSQKVNEEEVEDNESEEQNDDGNDEYDDDEGEGEDDENENENENDENYEEVQDESEMEHQYYNQGTNSLSTRGNIWNSTDRRGFTTQEFMANADNLMIQLRSKYTTSSLSLNEQVRSEDDGGEYTTVEESSVTSETETSAQNYGPANSTYSNSQSVTMSSVSRDMSSFSNPQQSASNDSNDSSSFSNHGEIESQERYPSVIVHSQKNISTMASVQNDYPGGQDRPPNFSAGNNLSDNPPEDNSRPTSPEKPGRRRMGVILGTDEMAKAIPKTLGSMKFDSKSKAWYKVHTNNTQESSQSNSDLSGQEKQSLDQRPKILQQNVSNTQQDSYQSNQKSQLQGNSSKNYIEKQASQLGNITKKENLPRTVSKIPRAKPSSVAYNSFSSDDVDVFSGIEDFDNSRGTQTNNSLIEIMNQQLPGSKNNSSIGRSNRDSASSTLSLKQNFNGSIKSVGSSNNSTSSSTRFGNKIDGSKFSEMDQKSSYNKSSLASTSSSGMFFFFFLILEK